MISQMQLPSFPCFLAGQASPTAMATSSRHVYRLILPVDPGLFPPPADHHPLDLLSFPVLYLSLLCL